MISTLLQGATPSGFFGWLLRWDQTIGAVGSLLTLLLVLVYIIQNKHLQEQTKALKAAYTPVVLVNSIRALQSVERNTQASSVEEDRAEEAEAEELIGDFIELKLSNVGNEIAREATIEYHVKRAKSSYLNKLQSFPLKSDSAPLWPANSTYYQSNSSGGVIPEDTSEARYTAEVVLSYNHGSRDVVTYQFRNCLTNITMGERVRFGMVLVYKNSAGEPESIPIEPGLEFTITEGIDSFKDVYDSVIDDSPLPGANPEPCDIERIVD